MPTNYSGTWDIVDNENIEGYMVALGEYLPANVFFLLKMYNSRLNKPYIP